MKKVKVSVVKLADYENERVYEALKTSLALLGGLEKILKPRSKVFVKINHLSPPSQGDRGIVTHPAFTKEVLRLLKEWDLEITVGDDIQSRKEDGFLISGYRQVCKELGIRLVNLKETGFREVDCQGRVLKKTYISPLLLEADFILNLPKLKTHSFTIFTGSIKNMFGIIPYGLRLKYHRQYISNEVFSQMLVDIFSCVMPHLTIMDGVVAMEGEGPAAGNLKRVGVVLASQDAVALDAVATKIVGYDPMDIYTTFYAHERGLGMGKTENIEIVGEKIHDVEVRNFKHSAIVFSFFRKKIPSFLYAYLQNQLTLIPKVSRNKCTACLECIDICPKGAAKLHKDLAWIDKGSCIHCMCCHEVCRYQAIKLRQRPLGKVIKRIAAVYRKVKSAST
ncbi:MAG: DUF362 domain-containing protein [Candidatus Aminicenantia bacterium]